MTGHGPTVLRRELGRQLQELRIQASIPINDPKLTSLLEPHDVWQVEGGQTDLGEEVIRRLCELYETDLATLKALTRMVQDIPCSTWWEAASPAVPPKLQLSLCLWPSAQGIRCYEQELIPSLLQTEEYAREVRSICQPWASPALVDRQVEALLNAQQAVFSRSGWTGITAILNASVINRPVGGWAMLNRQVRHLETLTDNLTCNVRVLPWSVEAHPAMTGSFTILDFEPADYPSLVCLEQSAGTQYLEHDADLENYSRLFGLALEPSVPLWGYTPEDCSIQQAG
jgi:hypothetical protein